jgi:hypothetical protein
LAIANFSVDNIKTSQPYSVLEDVFVPLYFFHRYQTEAVSKLIGGLEYNYAVKGGVQKVVKNVNGNIERKALQILLKTIDVNEIAIPKRLLNLFPPRAIGFNRTRESFKSKNGVAFDSYGAVATASEMTLELLFHKERVSRMLQHKSLDNDQLGLDEMIDVVVQNSFKKAYDDSYYQELQNVVNSEVLRQLFNLSSEKTTYSQINAIVNSKLNAIESYMKVKKSKGLQKIYEDELIKTIENFKKHPSNYKNIEALSIPDGSPIGME